ncbi:hypothetical protein NLI96_g3078 [Meripilus lineatus]|uniref:Cyclin N-terminal domain-containing protein n=1 Tax=Meripilus lineatus TaxID=2056292 RepID=A0AAD5VCV0_9APHY|nr:hypothetical protein NLI96_g3078 [Physisporinus lineatus]
MSQVHSASTLHPASLADRSSHSPALLELVDQKMSRSLIEYTIDCVMETVRIALRSTSPKSPRGRSQARKTERVKLTDFVTRIVTRANIKVATLLVALVYIDRATPFLQISTEMWAGERVFLGALMLAYKYVNDATLKNFRWAIATGVFGTRDVGRVEREFLQVLDYELNFTEDDVLSHHTAIKTHARLRSPTSSQTHTFPPNRVPFPRSSSQSCWSDDSDEEDNSSDENEDGHSSPDSGMDDSTPTSSPLSSSLPRTPEGDSDNAVDPSTYLRFPSKRPFQSPPPPHDIPRVSKISGRSSHPAFRILPLPPLP